MTRRMINSLFSARKESDIGFYVRLRLWVWTAASNADMSIGFYVIVCLLKLT